MQQTSALLPADALLTNIKCDCKAGRQNVASGHHWPASNVQCCSAWRSLVLTIDVISYSCHTDACIRDYASQNRTRDRPPRWLHFS